jgi:hypothetical protein
MCSLGPVDGYRVPGIDQSGYIVHLVPGSKPAEAALAELFVLPDEGYGSRAVSASPPLVEAIGTFPLRDSISRHRR